jgi:GIY-YIG catalytic domain
VTAKKPRISGIYQIQNSHTGRVYIGQSRNIEARWNSHRDTLRKGKHINDALQADWEAYGEGAFTFTIVEQVEGWNALCEAEARHCAASTNLYNAIPICQPRPVNHVASLVDSAPDNLQMAAEMAAVVNALQRAGSEVSADSESRKPSTVGLTEVNTASLAVDQQTCPHCGTLVFPELLYAMLVTARKEAKRDIAQVLASQAAARQPLLSHGIMEVLTRCPECEAALWIRAGTLQVVAAQPHQEGE